MSLALDISAPQTTAELRYQKQDSALTLAEGLEEYYRANVGVVTRPCDLPPKSRDLFERHDICHVIFGLNTTLADESLADTRTLLSCDVGFRRYIDYLRSNKEARAIFKKAGYLRIVWIAVLAVPRILRAVLVGRHMTKRWPWSPPASYRERSLADLRREFGIRVV